MEDGPERSAQRVSGEGMTGETRAGKGRRLGRKSTVREEELSFEVRRGRDHIWSPGQGV